MAILLAALALSVSWRIRAAVSSCERSGFEISWARSLIRVAIAYARKGTNILDGGWRAAEGNQGAG